MGFIVLQYGRCVQYEFQSKLTEEEGECELWIERKVLPSLYKRQRPEGEDGVATECHPY